MRCIECDTAGIVQPNKYILHLRAIRVGAPDLSGGALGPVDTSRLRIKSEGGGGHLGNDDSPLSSVKVGVQNAAVIGIGAESPVAFTLGRIEYDRRGKL